MKKIFLLFTLMFCMVAYAEYGTFITDEKLSNLEKQHQTNNDIKNDSYYWAPYMLDLERRIKRNWIRPKGGNPKPIVATITVDRIGRLLDCEITKSSGIPEADKAVMNAIKLTAPFKPLPKEFKGNSIPMKFTFDNTQYRK